MGLWLKFCNRRWVFAGGVLAIAAGLGGCASSAPVVAQPQYVVPEFSRLSASLYGYSQAVRVGPWITVAGQVGYNPKTHRYGKTMGEQARLAFADLKRVLHAAGARMSDVTSITTYQTDMRHFNTVVHARNVAFGDHRPVWTAVGVKALARPGLQFQVSATAYAPANMGKRRAGSGAARHDPGQ